MLRAIERGWVQQEIQNAAYEYQRAVDTGDATVVGVNRFTREEEPEIPSSASTNHWSANRSSVFAHCERAAMLRVGSRHLIGSATTHAAERT